MYCPRNFSINLTEVMWQSGEVGSLASTNMDQVWEQSREKGDLPDLPHFKIVQGWLDISQLERWRAGTIELWAL
jgi:hypothetical protein